MKFALKLGPGKQPNTFVFILQLHHLLLRGTSVKGLTACFVSIPGVGSNYLAVCNSYNSSGTKAIHRSKISYWNGAFITFRTGGDKSIYGW
jgi:hypothetical protein